MTDPSKEARDLALRACRQQGCTCDVEITVEIIDGLDAPCAAVAHKDWCPLLRVEQEKPPGLGRWPAVLRPD